MKFTHIVSALMLLSATPAFANVCTTQANGIQFQAFDSATSYANDLIVSQCYENRFTFNKQECSTNLYCGANLQLPYPSGIVACSTQALNRGFHYQGIDINQVTQYVVNRCEEAAGYGNSECQYNIRCVDSAYAQQPPVAYPQPPVVYPRPPVVVRPGPVYGPRPPVYGPRPPIYGPRPPVYGPRPPVYRPRPPVVVVRPPVYAPRPPVYRPRPPVVIVRPGPGPRPRPPVFVPGPSRPFPGGGHHGGHHGGRPGGGRGPGSGRGPGRGPR